MKTYEYDSVENVTAIMGKTSEMDFAKLKVKLWLFFFREK